MGQHAQQDIQCTPLTRIRPIRSAPIAACTFRLRAKRGTSARAPWARVLGHNSLALFAPRLLTLLLALALPAAARAGEVRFPGHTMTVPDGFDVELVAGPPLVDRPIVGDFDERGRLYVAESSGANDRMDVLVKNRPHWISRLVDSDGDGRFDKKTMFADKMSFPEGTMWYDGALYVASPPEIWKLEDTDDDGVADRRTPWVKDFPLTGCGNDLHGPYLGPDGRIYWTKGGFGPIRIEKNGRVVVDDKAAHIFRARPDGSDVEPIIGAGMDNPVDVTHTAEGEPIFTCTFITHREAGKRDAIVHAVYGGVFGKVHAVMEGLVRTGDLLPPILHLGAAAPSGLHRYQATALGDGFRDNLFSTQFNLRKVQRHVLSPEGATFKSKDEDFVVSDNADFHPTDVFEDADGSLIVIDTGGWFRVCCPTSQIAKPEVLGGIYRVRRRGAPRIEDPRGARIAWAQLPAAGLAALLDDGRPAVVRTAIERLAKLGSSAVPALAAARLAGATAIGRRNAVWALTRIDGADARAAVRVALDDRDPGVRQAATHSAGLLRDHGAEPRLIGLLRSGSPHATRAAATALGRMKARRAVPALLAAAAAKPDRVLEHALVYALIEIADVPATRRGLAAKSTHTRRAALIALSGMGRDALAPEAVVPLLTSKDPVLRQTASWVVGRRKEWGAVVMRALRPWLAEPKLSPERRDELRQRIVAYAEDPIVQDIVATALRTPATAAGTRTMLLQAMGDAPLPMPPTPWSDEVAHALASADETVAQQAVATAKVFSGKRTYVPLRGPLLELARDERRPADLRLAAIAALPTDEHLDGALFQFLAAHLAQHHPPLRRAAAAEALGRAHLAEKELLALARMLVEAGALELPKLLVAYERGGSEHVGMTLLAALDRSKNVPTLRIDALNKALAKFPAAVQRQSESLAKKIQEDLAEQKARLSALGKRIKGGDRLRGAKLFNGPKAQCVTCHPIGRGQEAAVGPDLTTIGRIRTETDLLEAIVFPSASFARGFEPYVITTKDGGAFGGVIRDETSAALRLVTSATNETRVLRADIKDMQPDLVSIMPAGFDQVVTPEELADLIAFLVSLK